MANYRQIHVSIWKDEWFLDLEPEEKLLFVYLFSNESASLSGLYKLAFKVICFETGLDKDFVAETLEKFEATQKVYYRDGILWVKNLRRYNQGGDTVRKRILKDVDEIPDCELKRMYIGYYGDADTPDVPPPDPDDTPPIGYEYPSDRVSTEMKRNESEEAKVQTAPTRRRRSNADARTSHPAIQTIFRVTGRYPAKDQYDSLIKVIGDAPDEKRLKECFQVWAKDRRFSPVNYGWAVDWYINGIPDADGNRGKVKVDLSKGF